MPNDDIIINCLNHQNQILNSIINYETDRQEIFPHRVWNGISNNNNDINNSPQNNDINNNTEYITPVINIGVVFIGFPTQILPKIQKLYFNELDQRTTYTSHYNKNNHNNNNDNIYLQKFHLIETSFHIEKVLNKYMTTLIRQTTPSSLGQDLGETNHRNYNVNRWEMESLLASLYNEMLEPNVDLITGLTDSSTSQLTSLIFILNNKLSTDDYDPSGNANKGNKEMLPVLSYQYIDGFSKSDIRQLQQCEHCVLLSKQIINTYNTYSKSRRVVKPKISSADNIAWDIGDRDIIELKEKHSSAYNRAGRSDANGDALIQEVKSSRLWAHKIDELLTNMNEQEVLITCAYIYIMHV
jgi:hypothetical protein